MRRKKKGKTLTAVFGSMEAPNEQFNRTIVSSVAEIGYPMGHAKKKLYKSNPWGKPENWIPVSI